MGPSAAERLAGAGMRPTAQRLAVIAALEGEPDGATAQDLHRRLRDDGAAVGLATVYRTLAALHEHDLVDSLLTSAGEARYRVCHAAAHHHHLVCRRCERVVELDGCDVEDWVRRVSARHGFGDLEHSLELTGLCPDCT